MRKPIQSDIASQDLSAGALAHTLTIGEDRSVEDSMELLEVAVKCSGNVSQTVTVSRESGVGGSNYTLALDTETLSTADEYIFRPTAPVPLKRGDVITVAMTNSGTPSVTAYSEIRFRESA